MAENYIYITMEQYSIISNKVKNLLSWFEGQFSAITTIPTEELPKKEKKKNVATCLNMCKILCWMAFVALLDYTLDGPDWGWHMLRAGPQFLQGTLHRW